MIERERKRKVRRGGGRGRVTHSGRGRPPRNISLRRRGGYCIYRVYTVQIIVGDTTIILWLETTRTRSVSD